MLKEKIPINMIVKFTKLEKEEIEKLKKKLDSYQECEKNVGAKIEKIKKYKKILDKLKIYGKINTVTRRSN